MYGAPSRSWFAVALASERATIATSSCLWQTSPSSLAKFHACPNLAPSPSFAGALTGWRQCCQMARLQRRVLPSQPFVANRTFFRAAVRSHHRLFALAVVALCLAGLAAEGMPTRGVYPGSDMGCDPCEPLIDRGPPPPPCAGVETRRCTMRRTKAIARSSQRCSARAPTWAPKAARGAPFPSGLSGAVADGDADVTVPAPSASYTALHHAACYGRISAGVELLVGGADPTITNGDG
jgi:hypothetical protein